MTSAQQRDLLERAARLLETFGGTAPQYNGQVFAWLSDYEAHKSAETTEREREREDAMTTIHWGGGATVHTKNSTIRWALGFPICCTGHRAIRIAREGRQTFAAAAVTCKSCLRGMRRDPAIADAIASRGTRGEPGGEDGTK